MLGNVAQANSVRHPNLVAEPSELPEVPSTIDSAIAQLLEPVGSTDTHFARIAELEAQLAESQAAVREQHEVADALRATQARLNSSRLEAERKLESLWEALGEEAESRDWCSEYDDFADAHGGPRRKSPLKHVTVTVEFTFVATPSDIANSEPSDYWTQESVVNLSDVSLDGDWDIDGSDYTITSVDVADAE